MTSRELPDVFPLQFTPEDWTSLHKLRRFLGPPLPQEINVRIGLRDCEQHLEKVEVLWRVAERLRPSLALDNEEPMSLVQTIKANRTLAHFISPFVKPLTCSSEHKNDAPCRRTRRRAYRF